MKAVRKLNYDQARPYHFVLSPVLANLTDEAAPLARQVRKRLSPMGNDGVTPHAGASAEGQPVYRKSLERLRIAATTVSALEQYAGGCLGPIEGSIKNALLKVTVE